MSAPLAIFDGHLDLAMNACRGRDVLRPAAEQPVVEGEIPTVGLPDLRAGGVTDVVAVVFCEPKFGDNAGYATADQAYAMAQVQLAVYRQWEAAGEIGTSGNIASPTPRALLLIEGADCVRTPDDLHAFHAAGVRAIGLAWHATRYAGGTGEPGPLTAAGRELVRHIDRLGMVHDASHLAERSFWDLCEVADRPIVATHSNCRAIVGEDPKERHLTDAMVRVIVARGGVVGINFFDRFLLPAAEHGKRRATLDDVVAHVRHICDLAGNADHVGLGTDMDGGLGREQIPVEIATSADLPKAYDALLAAEFGEGDARKVIGGNWRRFFGAAVGTA